jgi:hypothetical protein
MKQITLASLEQMKEAKYQRAGTCRRLSLIEMRWGHDCTVIESSNVVTYRLLFQGLLSCALPSQKLSF